MNYNEVEIYGQLYTIKTDMDETQLKNLVGYVNNKMNELKNATGMVSTSKVAILAALNIAEELFQLRDQKETMEDMIAQKSSHILSLIDECKTS